jgi:hypothetical protein
MRKKERERKRVQPRPNQTILISPLEEEEKSKKKGKKRKKKRRKMAIKQHLGPTLTNLTREKEIKERRKGRERPSCAALGHNTKHPNKRGKEEKKEKK